MTFWTGKISASNEFYPEVEKFAGHGPHIVMGRSTKIWNQRQGDGHYRIDLGVLKDEKFGKTEPFDISTDIEGAKEVMLREEHFGHHCQQYKDLIRAMEGPLRAWPIYYMPIEHLNWTAQQDVTLVGDAAHTTTPFVGDGVNCALRDTVILTEKLKQHGFDQKAIAEYEKDMFAYGIDVIERSLASGELFFHPDSPTAFLEGMKARPLIGTKDEE